MPAYFTSRDLSGLSATGLIGKLGVIYVLESVLRES